MNRRPDGQRILAHRVAHKGRPSGLLYVPASVRAEFPAEARFRCEVTPAGILFRRLDLAASWTAPAALA